MIGNAVTFESALRIALTLPVLVPPAMAAKNVAHMHGDMAADGNRVVDFPDNITHQNPRWSATGHRSAGAGCVIASRPDAGYS